MKMPKTPPDFNKLWEQIVTDPEKVQQVFSIDPEPATKGKYLHWDKLRHYSPPKDLSHEQWWLILKRKRKQLYKSVPLCDKDGQSFKYLTIDPIPEILHKIDQDAGGLIQMPEQITNPDTEEQYYISSLIKEAITSSQKEQYYISSLIKEAITSSQLEGAATTRFVAEEMIQTGRKPTDKSEQMILNNFSAMKHIRKLKDKPLTKELIFELHRLVTEKTLDDPSATGRFRKDNKDEKINICDMYNEVFHDPPHADELENRMELMCDFANEKKTSGFIHPIIRSIILHFWLAYDHPFVDGNGRTARALFYWSMLHHNFWLFEFISISQIILQAPAKYGRAFLYTETDENDLTYFILYHLEVIQRAIKELNEYIKRKTEKLQKVERELQGIIALNHRQRTLIIHALRHPNQRYTFKSHQISHNIVYQTSRLDLLDLENRGLLTSKKVGRTWYFTPITKLEEKLINLPT